MDATSEVQDARTQKLEKPLRSVMRKFYSSAAKFQTSGKRKASPVEDRTVERNSRWEKGYLPQTIPWNIPKVKDFTQDMVLAVQKIMGNQADVWGIQLLAKIILEEYEIYRAKIGFPQGFELDSGYIRRLANTATAFFLEEWLVNDSDCRMTINKFSRWGFAGEPEDKSKIDKYAEPYLEEQKRRRA